MKQGNKMGILAKMLSTFGYEGLDHRLGHAGMSLPSRGRNKSRRVRSKNVGEQMYKSATSGFPRSTIACGSIPAPTMDQVRRIERKYGQRLKVMRGLLFFKCDDVMFTQHEAQKRYSGTQS